MEDIREDGLPNENSAEILAKSTSTLVGESSDEVYLCWSDISGRRSEMIENFANADFDLTCELWIREHIRSSLSTVYQSDEAN